jgi:hypothetical protein
MRCKPRALAHVVAAFAYGSLLAAAGQALAQPPGGTSEQRAWVRSAATRFVTAELAADGASACSILVRRLRGTEHGRTCAERWDAHLAVLLRKPGERAALRHALREIPQAPVALHGDLARINLPAPLLGDSSRFLWTENCWMLQG